jgi:hypothetical protein
MPESDLLIRQVRYVREILIRNTAKSTVDEPMTVISPRCLSPSRHLHKPYRYGHWK